MNEWFELRRSAIQGVGAFAITDIPKGTRIIEYEGERITNAEADRRDVAASEARHHTFLFILNKRTVIDAAFDGNEARFINHSCDPNCDAVIEPGHIWIDALKRIPAGTELAYDYEYDDEDYTIAELRLYGCRCGSPKCRGTIVDTKRLLKHEAKASSAARIRLTRVRPAVSALAQLVSRVWSTTRDCFLRRRSRCARRFRSSRARTERESSGGWTGSYFPRRVWAILRRSAIRWGRPAMLSR